MAIPRLPYCPITINIMATYEQLVLVCGLHPEVVQGAAEQEGQGSLHGQGIYISGVITLSQLLQVLVGSLMH